MAVHQPYMYDADQRNDSRFPASTFDPKAVTRASWEKKPPKPKQLGPLISFDRHPDAHMVLNHRSSSYTSMSPRTKNLIKWTRRIQLGLRVLQLNAAMGILIIMVLLDKIDTIKAWVMRIAPGLVVLHTLYSVYHLSRDAAGRTPSSSAAYQVFSIFEDLAAMALYAFSAFTTHSESEEWTNKLPGRADLTEIFVPAVYYTLVVAGGLHVVSLGLSLWLAWAFHIISTMPPDMNPLEDNLTARPKHKRNKSSVTTLTSTDSNDRASTPRYGQPGSYSPFQNTTPGRTMPFMHTRQGSSINFHPGGTRADMPERQYQIVPSNTPRSSATLVEPKHLTRPMSAIHGTYAEIPKCDPSSYELKADQCGNVHSGHVADSVDAWDPAGSLGSRANKRRRQAAVSSRESVSNNAAYAPLAPHYNADDSSDSEYEDENMLSREDTGTLAPGRHPNPLGSNPLQSPKGIADRTQTPFHSTYQLSAGTSAGGKVLHETSVNRRRASNSEDIADLRTISNYSSKRWSRNRDASIQPDSGFYSKPYGELKSATPPVMVGNDRKTSTGNDFGSLGYHSSNAYERRNVSGKIAEEGRVGKRISLYNFYSDGK